MEPFYLFTTFSFRTFCVFVNKWEDGRFKKEFVMLRLIFGIYINFKLLILIEYHDKFFELKWFLYYLRSIFCEEILFYIFYFRYFWKFIFSFTSYWYGITLRKHTRWHRRKSTFLSLPDMLVTTTKNCKSRCW